MYVDTRKSLSEYQRGKIVYWIFYIRNNFNIRNGRAILYNVDADCDDQNGKKDPIACKS